MTNRQAFVSESCCGLYRTNKLLMKAVDIVNLKVME